MVGVWLEDQEAVAPGEMQQAATLAATGYEFDFAFLGAVQVIGQTYVGRLWPVHDIIVPIGRQCAHSHLLEFRFLTCIA